MILQPGVGIYIEKYKMQVLLGEEREIVKNRFDNVGYDVTSFSRVGGIPDEDCISVLGLFLYYGKDSNILKNIQYSCEDPYFIDSIDATNFTFMQLFEYIKSIDNDVLLDVDQFESKKIGIGAWIGDLSEIEFRKPDSIMIFSKSQ